MTGCDRRLTWPLVVLAGFAFGVPTAADNWPHWRGPAAAGTTAERGLPERWSDSENLAWKARLGGLGVSSPVVWNGRVLVTSQAGAGVRRTGPRLGARDEQPLGGSGSDRRDRSVRFLIEALAAADGRRLWAHGVEADGPLPSVHDKHNLASSSPVTDGERVYAVFGTGQIVAVDLEGSPVWTRNLAREFGAWDINWGHGSSPIVHRGALILAAYHPSSAYLIAMNGRTGETIWKTGRPRGVTSYSTPLVVPTPSGDELVVNSSTGVEAYDPATGRELWQFNERNQFPIPVAVHHAGVIYLSRGYRSGPYLAIRPGGRGDVTRTHLLWRMPTGAPYISSLVVYDGLIYMAGDIGVVTCVDAKNGERVWRERLGGVYTASPVAGDGKIYLPSETGETLVIRAGRKPEVVARNTIAGRVLASPAISAGRLYIRTDDHVFAVGTDASQ